MVERLAILPLHCFGCVRKPGVRLHPMPPSSISLVDTSSLTRALIKEKIIAFLREEVQIPVDDIDDDAPLSHPGIDSLGIASIHCELEQATRKRVNPDSVYALDTIAELADYLDSLPIATSTTKCSSAAKFTSAAKCTAAQLAAPTASAHIDASELLPD